MKNKLIAIAVATSLMCSATMYLTSCGNSDQAIQSAVKTAVSEAISHTPPEFQKPLANYIEVGAKGVYSIDGTPTVNELTTKVIAFIPKDVQDKYPLITTTITTAVSFAYITYGKSGLTSIGKGLEAGAAPWIEKGLTHITSVSTETCDEVWIPITPTNF